MSNLKTRIENLEKEQRFREWFHFQRFIESCTEEQREMFIIHGYVLPSPPPTPPGASRLDAMDRKTLHEMWQSYERRAPQFDLRSEEDLEFFCIHGHWPEQQCEDADCTAKRRK